MSCPKFDEFREQFIPFVDDFFINFSLIIHEKTMNIPDDLENDFEDNLNFYVLCLLLGGNAIFETLRIRSGERTSFRINRESLLFRILMLWDLRSSLLMLYRL